MKEGWVWDWILNTAARPSPRSTTPAFSPGPWSTRGPFVGSVRRWILLLLYEQCSDQMTEKSPSSVRLGSRPMAFTMRWYSSAVRLCSGRTADEIDISFLILPAGRAGSMWIRPLFFGYHHSKGAARGAHELHPSGHPRLLPPHRARARPGPDRGKGLLPAHRLHQRPLLRDHPAGPGRVPEDGSLRGLPLPLRTLSALHPPRAIAPDLGGRLPGGRPALLLVPPMEPRDERGLGGAHRPPPERGVQPRGGPPAGRVPGLVLLGLLPPPGPARSSPPGVPDRILFQHPLSVLDPHPDHRPAGPAGVGLEHALPPSRPPCAEPEDHPPQPWGDSYRP